jgi:D-glycero-D-manno-heptose 1,7-bisphosphate phosphatase
MPRERRVGRPAVFVDRDGVLNELVVHDGVAVAPRRAADFRIRPGARRAVERLRGRGLPVLVVTNQPELARGNLALEDHAVMTERMRAELGVDAVAVCPHDDADQCRCRKPAPGLLLDLATRWGVDLHASFMIGDSWKDVEAGRRAGCMTILLGDGAGLAPGPDRIAGTLEEAVAVVESALAAAREGA